MKVRRLLNENRL